MPSPKGKVDWSDITKVAIGAGIAAAGAALTYISEWVAGTDFGVWTPVVVSTWAVLVNFTRKLLTDTQS